MYVCLTTAISWLKKSAFLGAGVVISPIYLLTPHPFCLKMNISVNLRSAGTPSMILLTWLNELLRLVFDDDDAGRTIFASFDDKLLKTLWEIYQKRSSE